jgi:hypothetical protein
MHAALPAVASDASLLVQAAPRTCQAWLPQ